MESASIMQPKIAIVGEEVVVSFPRAFFQKVMGLTKYEIAQVSQSEEKKKVDFSSFIGVLKDAPEFKGKTSVEVQHMLGHLWANHSSSSTPIS